MFRQTRGMGAWLARKVGSCGENGALIGALGGQRQADRHFPAPLILRTWVAMPTGQVLVWHLRIMMQPCSPGGWGNTRLTVAGLAPGWLQSSKGSQ